MDRQKTTMSNEKDIYCLFFDGDVEKYVEMVNYIHGSEDIEQVDIEGIDPEAINVKCTKEALDKLTSKFEFERISDPDTLRKEQEEKNKVLDNLVLQVHF